MEEAFRRRVVRCAYGIVSGRLHQFYLPYLRLVEGCGTEDAVVVMYTSTVEQQRIAIEQQSLVGRIFYGAYSEGLCNRVAC